MFGTSLRHGRLTMASTIRMKLSQAEITCTVPLFPVALVALIPVEDVERIKAHF